MLVGKTNEDVTPHPFVHSFPQPAEPGLRQRGREWAEAAPPCWSSCLQGRWAGIKQKYPKARTSRWTDEGAPSKAVGDADVAQG